MRAYGLHAADSEAADVESRLTDADRNTLSGLAARAHAFIELEIVADHFHARQRTRSVADQRRALDRRFDLAVLDEIGLGALEDELARGDIDLTASEINRINPAFQAGEDLFRRLVAGGHEGVGHARHRPMRVAFAAAVAGRGDAGQARIHAVLQIAF